MRCRNFYLIHTIIFPTPLPPVTEGPVLILMTQFLSKDRISPGTGFGIIEKRRVRVEHDTILRILGELGKVP